MEGVEGLLVKMNLSSKERKCIKFGTEMGSSGGDRPPQVVAKLFSESVVLSEAIE